MKNELLKALKLEIQRALVELGKTVILSDDVSKCGANPTFRVTHARKLTDHENPSYVELAELGMVKEHAFSVARDIASQLPLGSGVAEVRVISTTTSSEFVVTSSVRVLPYVSEVYRRA